MSKRGLKGLKWEPIAAMVALLLLGVWIVVGPSAPHTLRPGAQTGPFSLPGLRGEIEAVPVAGTPASPGDYDFRVLYRDGTATDVISRDEFIGFFGQDAYDTVTKAVGNTAFRALNITSWGGVVWVCVGFLGQGAFFGRMFIQWLASEKKKQSVIPEAFWWLSLFGGVTLFAYFAWRQDIVGVLGQTSGVVIYARNIRLIHKQAKRAQRQAERERLSQEASESAPSIIEDPAPEPTNLKA